MKWVLVLMLCNGPQGCVPAYADVFASQKECNAQARSHLWTGKHQGAVYCVPIVKLD